MTLAAMAWGFVLFVASAAALDLPPSYSRPRQAPLLDMQALQDIFGLPGQQLKPVTAEDSPPLDHVEEDLFVPSASLYYDAFDWTLTKRLATYSNESFLISPIGVKLAMAILTEAATGQTFAELRSVLGFDLNVTAVRHKFESILHSYKNASSDFVLELGSRIYVDKGIEISQALASNAEAHYDTKVMNIDFAQSQVAVHDINEWVSNITKGRIPSLVNEQNIKGMVVMILNTLYFKGTWLHQFQPNSTREDVFYVTPARVTRTEFMTVQNSFYYTESNKYDAKILRMPYLGSKFSMYIIVPNSLSGLPLVIRDIELLRQETLALKKRRVEVVLPKYQFDYTSQLDGLLKELGIRLAFEDSASLPGLSRGNAISNKVHVSSVLQKAGIEVNELGTTAYAATEVTLINKFGEGTDDSVVEVIANRPFLFYIEDEATRQLLFTGRLTDPAAPPPQFLRP